MSLTGPGRPAGMSGLRKCDERKAMMAALIRWHAFGSSSHARPLSITFTLRPPLIRIISARRMNARERKSHGYEENHRPPGSHRTH
jgi:uncharacterized DUF497 family protein